MFVAVRSMTPIFLHGLQRASPPQNRRLPAFPHPTERCPVAKVQAVQRYSTIDPMFPRCDVQVRLPGARREIQTGAVDATSGLVAIGASARRLATPSQPSTRSSVD